MREGRYKTGRAAGVVEEKISSQQSFISHRSHTLFDSIPPLSFLPTMTILLVVGLCGLLATSAWAGQPRKLGPSPMFMAPLQDRNSTAGNNATVARSPFLSIEPSDVLNWVPCSPRNASRIAEGRIDCARLLVSVFRSRSLHARIPGVVGRVSS